VTTQLSLSFNFTDFNIDPPSGTVQSADMGRKYSKKVNDDRDTAYTPFSCMSIGFGVDLSRATVSANAGQLVSVTFDDGVLKKDDLVMFVHKSQKCDSTTPSFADAHTNKQTKSFYSSHAVIGNSGDALAFDFDGMQGGFETRLCVNSSNVIFAISSATIDITPTVEGTNYDGAGMYGDPHVRSATGEFLDFYGETGVYTLLDGNMQVNAKFGYAIRDNFMIWHPKVMRPGTLVEEVGITLTTAKTNLRLGTQGGGIVSVREDMRSTDFWSSNTEARSLQVGEYSIEWAKCEVDCEVIMPWGTHQRTQSLTVTGHGELLQLFVVKSGGYRFIDIEAMPSSTSTGLLADATNAPDALAERLLSGGEVAYQVPFDVLS
jgi:hypothetical protein